MLQPTIGPPLANIRSLYREARCYAYDPALGETGICRSAITYVDGDNGVLLYRGYPIADLVERCSYLEICWLLLNGELPSETQLDKFSHDITHHTMVNKQLHAIYHGFTAAEFPSDGGDVRGRRGAGGLLPRGPRYLRSAAPNDRLAPADRQDADESPRWPTNIRSDSPSCIRETTSYMPKIFFNMLFLGPVRTLPGIGRGGARPRRAVDHPGGPRTERLDLRDAAGRVYPSQPVCLHRSGDRRAMGTAARRRQRGSAADARRNRQRRAHSRDLAPREKARTTRSV